MNVDSVNGYIVKTMSRCSRVDVEIYFEDKNGNKCGVKGSFEQDPESKDPPSDRECENKPDSRDRDF